MPALIFVLMLAIFSVPSVAQDGEKPTPKPAQNTSKQSQNSEQTTSNNKNSEAPEADPDADNEEQKALKQFKGYDSEGNEILCSQADTIKQTVDGKVSYRCRTTAEALGEDSKSERGEGETNELIDTLLEQSKQTSNEEVELQPEQVRAIEQAKELEKAQKAEKASEDDTTQSELVIPATEDGDSKKPQEIHLEKPQEDENTPEAAPVIIVPETAEDGSDSKEVAPTLVEKSRALIEKIPIKFYANFRLNAGYQSSEWDISDGDTRFGAIYAHKFANNDQIIAHTEYGSNFFDQIKDALSQSSNVDDERKIYQRVAYLRYGRDDYYALLGKNWSVYHYIAGMTDRFLAVGGKAAGIYNAQTDGGATGTGRADNALQLRSSRGMFQWGVQLQANNPIPQYQHVNYDLAAALMFKIKTVSGFGIGAAVNRAVPETYTADMLADNFNGNSSALTVGLEWDYFAWYFAMVFSESQNHVTDDQLDYYDARGLELYSSRQITDKQMLRLGFNMQKPDEPDDYAGQHQIEEYYLSWQYNYSATEKKNIVFSEFTYNRGRNANGENPGNQMVVGVRYYWQN